MKKIARIELLALLIASLLSFHCGGDDSETPGGGSGNDGGSVGGDNGSPGQDAGAPADGGTGLLPWIDTHAHPTGIDNSCLDPACVDATIAAMDAYGVRKSVFMSPPSINTTGNEGDILAAVRLEPDRLLWGAGGTELNSLIQQTPDSGEVSEQMKQSFKGRVGPLLDGGEAVAVGEIAALHLSYTKEHPFEETSADTPLFLLLADEAAARDLAIDLHMDAVSQDLATPAFFVAASPNNPDELAANVPALEALLSHNANARIVWAHVGRDTTGQMTPGLVRSLIETHPNLYCQIAPQYRPLQSANAIVNAMGTIQPAWFDLLLEHPDRFVLGTDMFYTGTAEDAKLLRMVQTFLGQLPADLAQRVGCTNAVSIYRLNSGC